MADLNLTLDPFTQGFNALLNVLPEGISSKMETLLSIGKVLLVIVIVYILILIISKLLSIRTSRNISKISENVYQINQKLDLLLKDKSKKGKK